MKRPPRPGETIWVDRRALAISFGMLEAGIGRFRVASHHGLWIDLGERPPRWIREARKNVRSRTAKRWTRWYVHRFDEGVTWWRPDSVELKVLQVVEALA